MKIDEALIHYMSYLRYSNKATQTITAYMNEMNRFCKYLLVKYSSIPDIDKIKLYDLEEYLNEQLIRGIAQSSRARNYRILKTFYNFIFEKGYVDCNIALELRPIKMTNSERNYLVEDDVRKLINEISCYSIKVIVEFIFYTGLRISECINLRIKDVDLKNKIVHVISGKGGKNRDVPISNKLMSTLITYIDNLGTTKESEYFFATTRTGRVSRQYINRQINEACKRLGWSEHISAHVIRHSFASCLVKRNVDLVRVQKLLGHADLRTTSIYTHTSKDELRNAVNLI